MEQHQRIVKIQSSSIASHASARRRQQQPIQPEVDHDRMIIMTIMHIPVLYDAHNPLRSLIQIQTSVQQLDSERIQKEEDDTSTTMRERRVSPFLCLNQQQQQQQQQHQHPISGCHGFPRTLLVLLLILLLSPDAGCFWVSDAFSLRAAGRGPAQQRMPMMKMKMKMKRTTKNDHNEDEDDDGSNSSSSFYSMIRKNTETWKRSLLASGLAASTIALATATSPLPATAATAAPFPEKSVVELSRGAIVIQTASSSSSSDGNSNNINSPFIKSSSSSSMTDSKKLLQTLFQNRKEISASVGRIQSAINQELAREPSVWKELQKEFLSVEGDLASMIQVLPPSDWKATIQDVSAGKLNLVVNGELVNIQVLPNLGEREDDLLISIKGFKGNNDVFQFANTKSSSSSSAAGPQYGPIRSYFSKYEVFWSWWATPYPPQYLLPNMQASNGDVVLVGTAATIWLVYLSSYMYYEYEIEQERLAAEEKRLKIATAAAAAAAAKKKNKAAAAAAAAAAATAPGASTKSKKPSTSTTTNTKEKGKDKDKTNEDTAPTSTTTATTTSTRATKKKRRLGGLLFWRKK